MRIITDTKLDFHDVLIQPKRSTLGSRDEVELDRQFRFKHCPHAWEGIPIIGSNMDGVGTFSVASVMQKHRMITAVRKHYTLEEWDQALCNTFDNSLNPDFLSICTGSNAIHNPDAADYKLVKNVLERHPIGFICVDVANGYQQNFVDFITKVRYDYPDKCIIAGNVCTPEMTEELIIKGADIVKVGIGPGSVCTTRIQTGVGYPQLSAIIECSDAAHGVGGQIIGDGGCVSPGDIAKGFGGGADFMMLGGMLAFHDECEETIGNDGMVSFYGMSSDRARERHGNRKDGYRASEGKVVKYPCRGPINDTVSDILGGLSSACTYAGARRLKDLPKCTTFVKVNTTHNTIYEGLEIE